MKEFAGKISASMMCANLANLKETIEVFEKKKIDYLHIDVMDGEFVPNLGLGIDYIRGLREMTSIPLDLHLMINRPEDKLEWLEIHPGDMVSVHIESTIHVQRTLERVKHYGCKTMLAINPATPIYSLEEVLEYIDGINMLMVNPGFAGQKLVQSCIKKAERLEDFLNKRGYSHLLIEVDGNISIDNAKILRGIGADVFVAGSSSIFGGERDQLEDRIDQLYATIR